MLSILVWPSRIRRARRLIEPTARDAYRTAFRDPAVRHAMCEDYRVALHEDLAADRANRRG